MAEEAATEQKEEAQGDAQEEKKSGELSGKLEDIAKTIEGLTALELAELVKQRANEPVIEVSIDDL